MNRIVNFMTGQPQQYEAPPGGSGLSGGGFNLGEPLNADPDMTLYEEQRDIERAAHYQAFYDMAAAQIRAAKDAVAALANAPAGTLAVGGAALLALGLSGQHGGLRFLRWIGAGTLAASALIAIRRAAAGVE